MFDKTKTMLPVAHFECSSNERTGELERYSLSFLCITGTESHSTSSFIPFNHISKSLSAWVEFDKTQKHHNASYIVAEHYIFNLP